MERYIAEQFLKSAEFEGFKQMAFFFTLKQVSKKVNGCYAYKKDIAEEILAEAIYRFVKHLFSNKPIESKEGLMCIIVLNLIADRGRKRTSFHNKIHQSSDHIFMSGESLEDFSPEDLLCMEYDVDDLVKDAQLTEIEGKVITMLNHGYNMKTIAERLNVTPPYISQVVKSARKKFR